TGLIQGEAFNCSPTLSRGLCRPAWEWDSGARRVSAPLLRAPGPLVRSRSRRQHPSSGPRGAPRAQARPFKLAKCAPLGVPRVIPGPLGRGAAEGSHSSGARLPCEQSRRRRRLCSAARTQRAAALSLLPSFLDPATRLKSLSSASRLPRQSPDRKPKTRCHLNLRKIALEGANVIYKRDVGKVLMKLRKPRITATIWSSGKIICTGATSEEEAKFGARRLARSLQKLGFQVIFTDFKVVNVLAVCNMPFEIRLPEFTKNNRPHASYEPELHPAVCYRIKSLRATLQIFSTGSITVTGPNVKAVASAVEQIYPFVFESRKEIL
uniref:TATA-box binding protein like 1 n=1 Tax=Ovis aries TaxID=9940 RepID=A0AC11DGK8_SHEEP